MIRVIDLELFRADLRTRMPFKYGIATMTELPHVSLRLRAEIDGQIVQGLAADHLPPKWFTKDPARDPRDEIGEMVVVIQHAMQLAAGRTARTAFAWWQEVRAEQSAWGAAEPLPPLLTQFGTSLVERALLDALARHRRQPLHRLVHGNALGVDLGSQYPELGNTTPAEWLPATPLPRVFARHTVGLADPLTAADLSPETRVTDGLPQTLEECIARYGLRHFKIKINGRRDADLARLEQLADVLPRHAPPDFAFSLDGNEGFPSLAAFRDFWSEMRERPRFREFARHLLFIEQPLHRSVALDAEFGQVARAWTDRPPIIIDESDAGPDSLREALRLGYAGTSHKNCKGVFKSIANACRVAQLRRENPGGHFLLSGEDLSTVAPISLLQDLAVQALLGISSVERNGHHYFAGLSFWPERWQLALRREHPDLFHATPAGWAALTLHAGQLSLDSVNSAPFGTAFLPDLEALPRIAAT